ncbi:Protein associated with transcriptional elongation factor ell [Globisporangium polare]
MSSNARGEEDAAVVAVPEDGREYRVVVGRSLTGGGGGGGSADEHDDASENHVGGASAMMMALRQQSNKRIKTAGGVAVPTTSTSQHGGASEMCVSFRYEFQPASVDKRMPGLVTMDDSNGLQVLRGNSTGAPGGILFKGKAIENKEIDCLLIFDGTCFRLERCPISYTQLRHVRAPPARRRPGVVKALSDPTASSVANATSISSAATAPGSTAAAANTSATESPTQVAAVPRAGRGRGRGRGRGAKQPAAPRATKAAKPAAAVAPGSAPPARQPRKKAAVENASEQ